MAEAKARRAYDAAPVDAFTGQTSLVEGRKVSRDMAVLIATRSRELSQRWQRIDVETRQSDQANVGVALSTHEKLERDVSLAIERGGPAGIVYYDILI